MPVADRMNWDASADQNLLICFIDTLNPTGDQLRLVQSKMTDMGYNCSVKAVSQHLQKLRRKEGAGAAPKENGEGSSPAPTAPKTPSSRKRAAPGSSAKKTSASKGKKSSIRSEVVNAFMAGNNAATSSRSALDDEDDDEFDPNDTPAKKVKRESKVKEEKAESDGEAVAIKKEKRDNEKRGGDNEKRGGDEGNAIVV